MQVSCEVAGCGDGPVGEHSLIRLKAQNRTHSRWARRADLSLKLAWCITGGPYGCMGSKSSTGEGQGQVNLLVVMVDISVSSRVCLGCVTCLNHPSGL